MKKLSVYEINGSFHACPSLAIESQRPPMKGHYYSFLRRRYSPYHYCHSSKTDEYCLFFGFINIYHILYYNDCFYIGCHTFSRKEMDNIIAYLAHKFGWSVDKSYSKHDLVVKSTELQWYLKRGLISIDILKEVGEFLDWEFE